MNFRSCKHITAHLDPPTGAVAIAIVSFTTGSSSRQSYTSNLAGFNTSASPISSYPDTADAVQSLTLFLFLGSKLYCLNMWGTK